MPLPIPAEIDCRVRLERQSGQSIGLLAVGHMTFVASSRTYRASVGVPTRFHMLGSTGPLALF